MLVLVNRRHEDISTTNTSTAATTYAARGISAYRCITAITAAATAAEYGAVICDRDLAARVYASATTGISTASYSTYPATVGYRNRVIRKIIWYYQGANISARRNNDRDIANTVPALCPGKSKYVRIDSDA
ncbi:MULTISPECIES: hypothetical protein [Delftia]|uniref:hypothetical protein n=1 Tax=Delftia TaxID=80865 RepID=UPI001878D878|nr:MULTISPECIES: hypothetical protein [Delftia]WEM00096.1 hypothetical protein PW274_07360 [Delftia tsuruhatensis]